MAAAGDFVGEEVFGHEGVGEDGLGFEEEVFPFGAAVAGGVARAEVGHDELADSGKLGGLGGHGGGGMLAGEGHFGVGVGEGGFVDEDVGVAGEFDGAIAKYGISAIHHAPSDLRRPDKICAIVGASVGESDGLSVFEFAVEGSEGDVFGFGFFEVEGARAIVFGDAVGMSGDAVFELGAVYAEFAVIEDEARFDGVDAEGVGEVSLGIAKGAVQVIFEFGRTVDVDFADGSSESATGKESSESEGVVAVHVGDEDAADLAGAQIAAEELVLGAFTAVEEPDLGALGQAEGDTGDVARSGGNA